MSTGPWRWVVWRLVRLCGHDLRFALMLDLLAVFRCGHSGLYGYLCGPASVSANAGSHSGGFFVWPTSQKQSRSANIELNVRMVRVMAQTRLGKPIISTEVYLLNP